MIIFCPFCEKDIDAVWAKATNLRVDGERFALQGMGPREFNWVFHIGRFLIHFGRKGSRFDPR